MNDIEMIREYVKTKILTLDSRGGMLNHVNQQS